jgi:hypothetical protein
LSWSPVIVKTVEELDPTKEYRACGGAILFQVGTLPRLAQALVNLAEMGCPLEILTEDQPISGTNSFLGDKEDPEQGEAKGEKAPLSAITQAVGTEPVPTGARIDLPPEFVGVPVMIIEARKGWRITYEPPTGSECSACGVDTLARDDEGLSFCRACRESVARGTPSVPTSLVPGLEGGE